MHTFNRFDQSIIFIYTLFYIFEVQHNFNYPGKGIACPSHILNTCKLQFIFPIFEYIDHMAPRKITLPMIIMKLNMQIITNHSVMKKWMVSCETRCMARFT